MNGAKHVSEADFARTVEHLSRAQRLANTGSWEWDVETNEIVWSEQIFQIFGLDAETFQPSYPAFLERVHPDDRQAVEDAVQRAIDGVEDYVVSATIEAVKP